MIFDIIQKNINKSMENEENLNINCFNVRSNIF